MNILVTGGAGYIGSHTLIELYKAGHTAVVVDNLSNSNPESLRRVAEIIGIPEIPFCKVDIRDREGLERVFSVHKFDACIHFAGLKAVGESVEAVGVLREQHCRYPCAGRRDAQAWLQEYHL